MPFDVLVDKPVSLNDHLALLGITPVPMETLNRHKAAQEHLYRAHPLSTPWPTLGLFTVFAAIAGCMTLPTMHSLLATIMFTVMVSGLLTMVTVAVIATFITGMGIRIYGKPAWVESFARTFNDPMIPPPIRQVVREVRRNMPGHLVLGELRRKEVVFDPYIVIVQNGERACLGIWVGDDVIACAEMI